MGFRRSCSTSVLVVYCYLIKHCCIVNQLLGRRPSLQHLMIDRSFLLCFAKFEQLNFLSDRCYPRFRSLLDCCCFALRSLQDARLCLNMPANESPNLLCTFLRPSDVLRENLMARAQDCLDAATACGFLPLECEQPVDSFF